MDLRSCEKKVYSQNGEDGVTMKLVETIYDDHNNKFYVEFGVESGVECNTRILREKYKWNGLMMDGSHENVSINLRKEFITKDNVLELFRKYNVPQHINLLSVDIDGNDFYCLHPILTAYQCDIIICEYNATHLANEDKVVIYNEQSHWDCTNYFGASLLAYTRLCRNYNYSLVYCNDNGTNSFFVHNDIITSKKLQIKDCGDVTKIYKPPTYGYGPNHGHQQDPYNRKYVTSGEAMIEFIVKLVNSLSFK